MFPWARRKLREALGVELSVKKTLTICCMLACGMARRLQMIQQRCALKVGSDNRIVRGDG